MLAKLRGHFSRIVGGLKLAFGKVFRSERLQASGAAQRYRGEQQVADAAAKARKWLDRRKITKS